MIFPLLETERLYLQEINHSHEKALFDILTKKEVVEYYGSGPLLSYKDAKLAVNQFQNGFLNKQSIRWGLVMKENRSFIGTVGLNQLNYRHKRAEIGYELHPDFWKRGLASEAVRSVIEYAFNQAGMMRIGAVAYPQNERSCLLLRKMGFEKEGMLRNYIFHRGSSRDVYVFSLTREEWMADAAF
ncbi:GNAT family N-acetyltransferase [Bacillus massiliglaciei]|uniref:GNAT family N-acetyltransferase n=1 Tax=Bacillus massiliglaciei TaxID=1816693 RepID=UPI000ABFB256|nr:GNAT family protein [Bacillus massiliglaciei]